MWNRGQLYESLFKVCNNRRFSLLGKRCFDKNILAHRTTFGRNLTLFSTLLLFSNLTIPMVKHGGGSIMAPWFFFSPNNPFFTQTVSLFLVLVHSMDCSSDFTGRFHVFSTTYTITLTLLTYSLHILPYYILAYFSMDSFALPTALQECISSSHLAFTTPEASTPRILKAFLFYVYSSDLSMHSLN